MSSVFRKFSSGVATFQLAKRGRRMRSVGREIFAIPDGSVFAAQHAVGPVIRAPRHPGRDDWSVVRIVVQAGLAVDLISESPTSRRNQPRMRKAQDCPGLPTPLEYPPYTRDEK